MKRMPGSVYKEQEGRTESGGLTLFYAPLRPSLEANSTGLCERGGLPSNVGGWVSRR